MRWMPYYIISHVISSDPVCYGKKEENEDTTFKDPVSFGMTVKFCSSNCVSMEIVLVTLFMSSVWSTLCVTANNLEFSHAGLAIAHIVNIAE